jgi:hypothetical protein
MKDTDKPKPPTAANLVAPPLPTDAGMDDGGSDDNGFNQ